MGVSENTANEVPSELWVIAFPLPRALHLAGDTKDKHHSLPYQVSHHSVRGTQLALQC